MASSPISSVTSSSSSSAATASTTSNSSAINNDDFMTLLLSELKNQDPLNPMDSTEMMGQIAQLNSLNALITIQDTLKDLKTSQSMSFATNLIGKTVTAVIGTDEDAQVVSGVVSSMFMEDGSAYVEVDGQGVEVSTIVEVSGE